LEDALWRDFEKSGYLGIRNAPILVRHDGLAIILDPTMFYEKKISVGPLFYAVRSASTGKRGSVNKVFGAFGGAFEDYASDMLRRMYPSRPGLVDRVTFGAEGRDASGREFEVDASMVDPRSGINNAIVFEMKAAFLREDAILSDDVDEQFVDEIRSKYGRSLGNRDRDKGVAQVAKIIGAIIREEWVGKYREFVAVSLIFPVLIVHDSRLDAPGLSWFLKYEFMRLLGIEPKGTRVAPLTILTVDDLENLESSVGAFTLIEALRDYDEECPDRMRSFGNFLARSKYAKLIKPSEHVMHQSDELLEQVQRSLFPGTQCGGG
jgi:hypothetical protein